MDAISDENPEATKQEVDNQETNPPAATDEVIESRTDPIEPEHGPKAEENTIEPTAATVVVVEDISNSNSTEKSKEIENPDPVSDPVRDPVRDPVPDAVPEPIKQPEPSSVSKPKETEHISNDSNPPQHEDPTVESKPEIVTPTKPPQDVSTPLSPEMDRIQLDNPDGFGKDFNWEMHHENQELRSQNKEITAKLIAKEKEIATLEEALTTLHDELKFLESQEVQSVAKDLAKKNRKLSVQLQRERNRAAQTHIESQKLRSELATYSHHNFSPKKVVEPLSFSHRPLTERSDLTENEQSEHKEKENKDARDSVEVDLQKMKAKLLSTKNQLAVTKDLHNKMKIALQKELGVDTLDMNTIHEIIRDGGSWKGRSEKIALLQSRLEAMKRELELMNDIGRGARSGHETVIRNKNDEHKHQISQIAMERMKQYESAQLDIERLEQNVDELRGLIKAKNSRIKGLENTASSSRQKLQFFVKKSKSDDSLIETLQSQLNQQLKLQNALTKKEKALNRSNSQMTSLSETIKTQNAKIELLNQTIDEMKSKILEQSQQRTDRLEKLFSHWNDDDKNYQMGLLKSENETQKDVISSYKKNLV